MDCSPPGSSVHGIFQARILEWVAISFSRRSFWRRDWIQVSCIIGRRFTVWATREVIQITHFKLGRTFLTNTHTQWNKNGGCNLEKIIKSYWTILSNLATEMKANEGFLLSAYFPPLLIWKSICYDAFFTISIQCTSFPIIKQTYYRICWHPSWSKPSLPNIKIYNLS